MSNGIDRLLGELNQDEICQVDIDLLEPDPDQPRKDFNEESIKQLADSIRKHGLLQPILAQRRDDKFIILAGERRWRASKKAELTTIPVKITNFDNEQKLEISLIENIQRENLNPMDIAFSLSTLIKKFNLTQEEVAKKISKSRSYVANVLRLLALNENIQKEIRVGKISLGHAKVMANHPNAEEILADILENKLSVRETEKHLQQRRQKILPINDDLMSIQNTLEERLNVKAHIEINEYGKGKITLSFNSYGDLDKILHSIQPSDQ